LHIKELSLLDLHSSEEDSAEILIKNFALNAKLKKNMRSSSNENNSQSQMNSFVIPPPINSNKTQTNSYLNEIISKRIKYSTNPATEDNSSSTEYQQQQHLMAQPASIPSNPANNQELIASAKKERRIDKLIQYLTKSSLDSAGSTNCSVSSSTSSNESIHRHQQQQINSSQSFLIINNPPIPLPPPPPIVSYVSSSQQNKRKKNDASDTQQQQQQSVVSCSLPIENQIVISEVPQSNELSKSLTIIDNDTLQHMKNLDLNFDLKPNESSSSSSSSSSSCSSSASSVAPASKSKEKNNYKKNKKTLHSNGGTHNFDQTAVSSQASQQTHQEQPQSVAASESASLGIDLTDACSRKTLWNLLKSHSTQEEILDEFGSQLHDKISFWDLVKLKLKFSKNTQLKTTYEIIDDYTVLYSNMSTLLESFVEEHSSSSSSSLGAASAASKQLTFKKNENSSRSRSSSRNCRKQSSNSATNPLHRI